MESYVRKFFHWDSIYRFFSYKQVKMVFRPKVREVILQDGFAQSMLAEGAVSQQQYDAYAERICGFFRGDEKLSAFDECTAEDIYTLVQKIRREELGADAIVAARKRAARHAGDFDPSQGIDQREKKQELLQNHDAAAFCLCQTELTKVMEADVSLALKQGKKLYFYVHREKGFDLPDAGTLTKLMGGLDGAQFLFYDAPVPADACLFVYGEEGLTCCRNLSADAVVSAAPKGYFAKAVTNQMDKANPCVVYIPKGFDIVPFVPILEKSRLTFWHLAVLEKRYGDRIYSMTPQELYGRYPNFFANIYGEEEAVPFNIPAGAADFAEYDALRDAAVAKYLNGFSGCAYKTAYFDENLVQRPVSYDGTPQPGILVNAVKVRSAKAAQVIPCGKGVSPRTVFRPGMTGFASNFLFFMTLRLSVLYNALREDRPMEQTDLTSGHLDYMLHYESGTRKETFPLFCKTCIAKQENGEFLFFNFRLGGGSVTLGGQTFRWEKSDVDTDGDVPVRVHTPYATCSDAAADRNTYRKAVGEGRVNLVLIQDKPVCLRRGDVILPAAGVVVSLSENAAEKLLAGRRQLQDGYYDVKDMQVRICLDPPEGIAAETWETVQWAYGGGMTLIRDGKAICDVEDTEAWFAEDGWLSPLSRQTQESALHKLVKHPRTAVGTTEKGELVVLVFSGRTSRSVGADYLEMCRIARQLFPDICWLMNVDGGGSAVLGAVMDGTFMELSYPATSPGSTAGMVRPINTMLYIPISG